MPPTIPQGRFPSSTFCAGSGFITSNTTKTRLNAVRARLKQLYRELLTRTYVTADDARMVAVELGYPIGNWLGSVWHEGFRRVGYGKSIEASRKGGLISHWMPAA